MGLGGDGLAGDGDGIEEVGGDAAGLGHYFHICLPNIHRPPTLHTPFLPQIFIFARLALIRQTPLGLPARMIAFGAHARIIIVVQIRILIIHFIDFINGRKREGTFCNLEIYNYGFYNLKSMIN